MVYFSSGDAPFYFKEQLASLSWLPQVWNNAKDFGENLLPRLWIDYPFRFIVKLLSTFGFEWGVIEKMIWAVALVLGVVGISKLATFVIGKTAAYIAIVIYLANTYALFLFGGGQLGVALAYGLAPFVLLKFIQRDNKEQITNGLWLALLIVFDLRVAYLVLGAIVFYQIMFKTFHLRSMTTSMLVAGLVHAFWIVPTLLTGAGSQELGVDFTSPGMLSFLSFADFSHALSLLHPNWPENLFGKVYFLQPEFLIIPLIAFSALLFKTKRNILSYFALLVLLGTFLAKGAQAPFGDIFIWCFQHIPGFVMFRDPTKFYLFIALGYAMLIPFVLGEIAKHFKKLRWVIYGAFIIFWCFTIRPLFLGQLTGNFKPKEIPQEYVKLKDMLVGDMTASRTLWIPAKEQFAYASDIHPALSGTVDEATGSSVRYVIVPKDIERKLFLNEYRYSEEVRKQTIVSLEALHMKQDTRYSDIAVFENPKFTSMKTLIPEIVVKQQQIAHIGVVISVVSLLVCMVLLCR